MDGNQIPLIDDTAHQGADPVRPLTQPQAAALVGVTTRRINQIANEGDPPPAVQDKHGRVLAYPCTDFGKWLRARWARDAGVTSNGEIFDEKLERARLNHHQANIAALNEAERRSELLPAETVTAIGAAMVTAARAQVLAVHSKIRQRFPDVDTDLADAIEELCLEALEELGHDGNTDDLAHRVEAHLRDLAATTDADR